MKRIASLTSFDEAQSAYSLRIVAENIIRNLLVHDYDPIVLVREGFSAPPDPTVWSASQVDLRPVVPNFPLTRGVHDEFCSRVQQTVDALSRGLADADVVITHDIFLQDWYKEYNVAVRKYAETRPDLLWLNWLHSKPTGGCTAISEDQYMEPKHCRNCPPPGYLVYPNHSDRGAVAGAYGLDGNEWKIQVCRAGHALDPLESFPYSSLAKSIARNADLMNGQIVSVYPARPTSEKQIDKVIRLLAGCQAHGMSVRLLVLDWQSAGQEFQKRIDALLRLAKSLGLRDKVYFSSRLDPQNCGQGVPHHVSLELMDMSTVFVYPSMTETYGFVPNEAMLRGRLCVMNWDLRVLPELFKMENAIWMDFQSDSTTRKYKSDDDEQAFWNGEAVRLMAELRQNRALMAQICARREWSPQAVWPELVSLFGLRPVGV